jgi:hypothetical protein
MDPLGKWFRANLLEFEAKKQQEMEDKMDELSKQKENSEAVPGKYNLAYRTNFENSISTGISAAKDVFEIKNPNPLNNMPSTVANNTSDTTPGTLIDRLMEAIHRFLP